MRQDQPDSLEARITSRYASMSPQERRAADVLLEHAGDACTYHASELATMADVSKATFSRLVRTLEFSSFDAMREHLRALRRSGVPVTAEGTPDVSAIISQDIANLHAMHAQLDEAVVEAVAEKIAAARRVAVCGYRSSLAAATVLRLNLAQMRPDTWLAPNSGQSVAEDVADFDEHDLLIVMSFRRHGRWAGELVEWAAESGIPLALFADDQLRSIAGRATWWLECPNASPGAFDSHAAVMSLVSVVSDRVLALIPEGAQRIDHVNSVHQTLGAPRPATYRRTRGGT
ncbi:MurR/RpiR family transcriptional regulator [Mycolicibacterium aubagnense]|uniref:RpiR family transcriptional regulator n=1 Tax=Mycolicibacterium aubagnense TaxID=319707 RepID=A0ABN5YZM1_9MYCO|nr:MurR/RpiR family transcriptional regulator [Mycolicibacterium aubagnense]TLH65645.1 MurR/RpiR family transcriptional regulator [Mycolicibacterium aubagnense]WGI31193.1 MurR/RpiR family transcriptional regulator [Mycolicibacterium aubagnense]BBX87407.1 RpiR family transcriptional regulator [Mycolicibacterium aubagnense]